MSSPAKAGDPALEMSMSRQHRYYVYILASERNGTLYIGVTNDLVRRVYEHRQGLVEGFTRKYSVKQLVRFEEYNDVRLAIQREKRLKKWKRAWKMRLIEESNPDWIDLYPSMASP
jgi:putative endonuclease